VLPEFAHRSLPAMPYMLPRRIAVSNVGREQYKAVRPDIATTRISSGLLALGACSVACIGHARVQNGSQSELGLGQLQACC